jgi:hypothetical protein
MVPLEAVCQFFDVAGQGWHQLDEELRQGMGELSTLYPDCHYGMLHLGKAERLWVFEIFRASLRVRFAEGVALRYEHQYPNNASQHIDLAFVGEPITAEGKATLLGGIEAKSAAYGINRKTEDEVLCDVKRTRGISFEDVVFHIQNGDVLDILKHPNAARYPKQNIIVLNMEGYVYYLVPYIKEKGTRFLKTIIPSRKATKEYLG